MRKRMISVAVVVLLAGWPLAGLAKGKTDCEMQFRLKSWSVFYKKAKGQGTISCDNGQSASVAIKIQGGGLTFGKSEVEGRAEFTEVADISELYGGWAEAEAHAGASKSSGAQVLTKGDVQMALAGTGEGWNLGFAFGKFTIQPN